jgi:hypothetical protein
MAASIVNERQSVVNRATYSLVSVIWNDIRTSLLVETLQRDFLLIPSSRPDNFPRAIHKLDDPLQFLLVVTGAFTLFGMI